MTHALAEPLQCLIILIAGIALQERSHLKGVRVSHAHLVPLHLTMALASASIVDQVPRPTRQIRCAYFAKQEPSLQDLASAKLAQSEKFQLLLARPSAIFADVDRSPIWPEHCARPALRDHSLLTMETASHAKLERTLHLPAPVSVQNAAQVARPTICRLDVSCAYRAPFRMAMASASLALRTNLLRSLVLLSAIYASAVLRQTLTALLALCALLEVRLLTREYAKSVHQELSPLPQVCVSASSAVPGCKLTSLVSSASYVHPRNSLLEMVSASFAQKALLPPQAVLRSANLVDVDLKRTASRPTVSHVTLDSSVLPTAIVRSALREPSAQLRVPVLATFAPSATRLLLTTPFATNARPELSLRTDNSASHASQEALLRILALASALHAL